VHLFAPRTAWRGGDDPAQIDFLLGAPALGRATLEIVGPDGSVIRSFASDTTTAATPPRPQGGMPGEESNRPAGPAPATRSVPVSEGLHRFEWDLRAASTGGRGAGPTVPPGQYTVRLTIPGERQLTTPLTVDVHPRLVADGITASDLQAQYELSTRVAQLNTDVQRLQADIRAARQRLEGNRRALAALDALEQRVVTQSGQAYAQPMLAAQVSYLNGIVGRGDNRPHRDAYIRFDELRAEADAIRALLQRIR
jgi:hypothetical protein